MTNRIVKFIISGLYYFASGFSKLILRLVRQKNPGTLVVLTYHAVKPHQKDKFRNQLAMLKRIGKPVYADIASPLPAAEQHFAVTFDDGYSSFIDHALPILQENLIPATIFIPVGYLGKSPGWIMNRSHENYSEVVMSEEQLRSLSNYMIMIGSHCITHPHLTTLPPDKVHVEISGSKSMLESVINKKVTLLSFPFNNYDELSINEAKTIAYSRVFSNVPTYSTSTTDGFLMGRIDVTPDDWKAEYWLKLKGAYQWLPFAIAFKRIVACWLPKML